MSKNSSAGLSLKDLLKSGWDEHDLDPLMLELTTGSDRAAAIIASTTLDNDLADLLDHILVIDNNKQRNELLTDFRSPLGSFSARIKIIYAIGIISREYVTGLENVRQIRNVFAHARKPITFETDAIKEICLKLPKTKATWPDGVEMSEPRTRYLNYCATLSSVMTEYVPKVFGDRPNLWAVLNTPPSNEKS
ncbi:MAG: MltR family transcriptional regulator [Pseudomonadota bacterium]